METRELPLAGSLQAWNHRNPSPRHSFFPHLHAAGNLFTFFFLNIQINLTNTPVLSNEHIDNASSTIRRPRSLAPYRFGARS